MWILTEEYNDYDQHGQYFLDAWVERPSHDQLVVALLAAGYTATDEFVEHTQKGGGRIHQEYSWVHLFEHNG